MYYYIWPCGVTTLELTSCYAASRPPLHFNTSISNVNSLYITSMWSYSIGVWLAQLSMCFSTISIENVLQLCVPDCAFNTLSIIILLACRHKCIFTYPNLHCTNILFNYLLKLNRTDTNNHPTLMTYIILPSPISPPVTFRYTIIN